MPSCLKNSCLLSCIKGSGSLTARDEERIPLSSRFGVQRQLPLIPEFSESEVRSASFAARLENLDAGNVRYAPVFTGMHQGDSSWSRGSSSGNASARSVPLNYLYNSGDMQFARWSPKSAPVLRGYRPQPFVYEMQGSPLLFDGSQSPGTGRSQQVWYPPSAGQQGGLSYRTQGATSMYQPGVSNAFSATGPTCYTRDEATPQPKSARDWLEEYIVSARTGSEVSKKNLDYPPKLSLAKVAMPADAVPRGATPDFEDADTAGQYTPPGPCTPSGQCTPYGSFTPTSGISCSPSEQFSMTGGFDPSTIQFGRLLGRGNFSTVYKAAIDGMDFALKIVRNPVGSGTEALAGFMAKNVLHPNLVRICGVQNVTVHCSLDDSSTKPTLDRNSSGLSDKDGQASTEQPNSGRTLARTDACTSVTSDMFSDLARTLPQKGGAGREDSETWILMEYCDAGCLDKAIERGQFCENGRFEKPKMLHVLFAALEIASAMTHLHSCGIIHGDVKPENVLLQGCEPSPVGMEFTCKVGDFGLSHRTSIHSSHIDTFSGGTVTHMAPELLRDNVLTYAADVFSFGVLLWQLLTGKKPFASQTQSGTILSIVEGRRPKIPVYFPSWYAHLIEDCWHQNRHARPKFADIVERINLMVLAFERPRMIDPFVSATFSSSHSEMIVAYQGVQPFMEGDLHTNPFYEHADMLYESSSALCLPEGSCPDVSISFDNMQCNSRSGIVRQFSAQDHRQDRYKNNQELMGMPPPDAVETQIVNAGQHCKSVPPAASDDGSTSHGLAPTARIHTDTSDDEIGPADIEHRFMQFQNSSLPKQDCLAVSTKRCTTRVLPGGNDLRVTVHRPNKALLSTESVCPSSCGTPMSATESDSDFGGWSPPNRTGAPTHCLIPRPAFTDDDLFSSRSSTSGGTDGMSCIKPLEKLSLSMNGLSRMPAQVRSGMDLISQPMAHSDRWDPLEATGSEQQQDGSMVESDHGGAPIVSTVKIEEITDDQPLSLGQVSNPSVWDSFMTPPARDYLPAREPGSSCVVYSRYT